MKLLCDVCASAVASVFCCADEAALCSSCDGRVHAANKLATKHQRLPLLSDSDSPAEPAAMCDICQEMPSFFFCVEDRALLCQGCDVSVHSANEFAAKHSRFLLVGVRVGMHTIGSSCQKAISATSSTLQPSTVENIESAMDKPPMQAAISTSPLRFMAVPTTENCNNDNGTDVVTGDKPLLPFERFRKTDSAPVPKPLVNYSITKDGTLSTVSTINMNSEHKKAAAHTDRKPNTTTISIRTISAGQRLPFVAPVLSSINFALLQEEEASQANNSNNLNNGIDRPREQSNDSRVSFDVNSSLPAGSDHTANHLSSSLPAWRLDELLTDLVGACDYGQSESPVKESELPGFGLQEEQAWFSELDSLQENELSPSQAESVALVPEMTSPPTKSGLSVSHAKWASYPPARHWAFDYLFDSPHHFSEFPVVPNVGRRSSIGDSSASPDPATLNKRRKHWLYTETE